MGDPKKVTCTGSGNYGDCLVKKTIKLNLKFKCLILLLDSTARFW